MEYLDFDRTNMFIEFVHMEHWMDLAMCKLLLQSFWVLYKGHDTQDYL
jgi:hypothetical protein